MLKGEERGEERENRCLVSFSSFHLFVFQYCWLGTWDARALCLQSETHTTGSRDEKGQAAPGTRTDQVKVERSDENLAVEHVLSQDTVRYLP